jgi:hypothetical protein
MASDPQDLRDLADSLVEALSNMTAKEREQRPHAHLVVQLNKLLMGVAELVPEGTASLLPAPVEVFRNTYGQDVAKIHFREVEAYARQTLKVLKSPKLNPSRRGEGMAGRNERHVVPGKDGDWKVTGPGQSRVSAVAIPRPRPRPARARSCGTQEVGRSSRTAATAASATRTPSGRATTRVRRRTGADRQSVAVGGSQRAGRLTWAVIVGGAVATALGEGFVHAIAESVGRRVGE